MAKFDYPVHSVAELFPEMDAESYAAFKADIEANGQSEPIVLWKKQLIDGRHRLRACNELGIKPIVVDIPGSDDPLAYVLSHNLHRRHLTESQRAMVAAKIATMKVGDNQHTKKEGLQICRPSADEAAKALNVSTRSVHNAKQVLEHGAKAVQKAVEQGKLAVSTAAELATSGATKTEQTQAVKGGKDEIKKVLNKPEPASPPNTQAVHHPKEMAGPLMAHVSTLTKMLNDLKKRTCERGGEWIDVQAISTQISALKYSLKSAIYFADCPDCQGKRCAKCKQTGFLPELKSDLVDGAAK